MTAVSPMGYPPCLEIDHNCDSRKFVSKHVYPVTGPDPPMCEVGAFGRSNGHMWCSCAH